MRILVVCKRQFTGKDVVDDRYGRLFELPAQLAGRGHDVQSLLLSYRPRGGGGFQWPELPRFGVHSVNMLPWGPVLWPLQAAAFARVARPDLIWASSDVPHLLLGRALARRWRVPWVADLYDNYESFGLSRMPGVIGALRAACRHASGITVVGECLAEHVSDHYASPAPIRVVGNGVRTDLFRRRDREGARRELGLPATARLLGTAGALSADRGIGDLLEAFTRLAQAREDVHLVLAGPRDEAIARFKHPRLHDLGQIGHAQVGTLFSALDVGVVCNRDSDFGRYCYPLKLQEMRACGLPVVAARVGEAARALAGHPHQLYVPGDASSLIDCIQGQLQEPVSVGAVVAPDWQDQALVLEAFFQQLVAGRE